MLTKYNLQSVIDTSWKAYYFWKRLKPNERWWKTGEHYDIFIIFIGLHITNGSQIKAL